MKEKTSISKSDSYWTVDKSVEIPIANGDEYIVGTFISFKGANDKNEHFAIGIGDWRNVSIPTVRVHSECLTGDVFMSQRCDCGLQLKEAIELLAVRGGLILYLRQEGRGIGLYNKFAAYNLQDQGYDTYRANKELGFEEDQRSYKFAADMLLALDKTKIYLHTNNLNKKEQLLEYGIDVIDIINTRIYENPHNKNYLLAKTDIAGHQLFKK